MLTTSEKVESNRVDTDTADIGCFAGLFPEEPETGRIEDSSLSIVASGKTPTGQFPKDTKSTTSTETDSTTVLKTCNACGCSITDPGTSGNTQASKNETPSTPAAQGNAAPTGRWPANLIWSHVPDTDCPACEGDYPGCKLCGGTGVIRGCVCRGTKRVKGYVINRFNDGAKPFGGGSGHKYTTEQHADADGLETVEDWDCHPDCPVGMFPNAEGCKPHQVRSNQGAKYEGWGESMHKRNQVVGFNDSGSAARFFYCAKASRNERNAGGEVENKHPTVKPLAIMEYLLKLVTMPERNYVLDPFCGSGSTLVACKRLRLPCLGIDSDQEAVSTAMKRLKYANTAADRLGMPVAELKKRKKGLFV